MEPTNLTIQSIMQVKSCLQLGAIIQWLHRQAAGKQRMQCWRSDVIVFFWLAWCTSADWKIELPFPAKHQQGKDENLFYLNYFSYFPMKQWIAVTFTTANQCSKPLSSFQSKFHSAAPAFSQRNLSNQLFRKNDRIPPHPSQDGFRPLGSSVTHTL